MKRRLPFKVHGTPVAWKEDENDFKNLLDDINEAFNDTEVFRTFVNQHFPCWTGTMTCFMIPNSLAYITLISNNLVQRTKANLNQGTSCEKVIKLLFILELVDTWDDIKGIIDKPKEPIPELSAAYDPYDCVPVPNTMYSVDGRKWQGSSV